MVVQNNLGDDVRSLVRQTILEVLQSEGQTPATDTLNTLAKAQNYEQKVPLPHEVCVTLRGSERAIRLLEDALASGEALLEIAIGEGFGPKARVEARKN